MPGKLDAPVAQAGTNLSGGQRQRLSIARALVKRPQIISSMTASALDFRTDAALRQALMNEVKDAGANRCTAVSTIMNADQIIVLDQGTVVGRAPMLNLWSDVRSTGNRPFTAGEDEVA